MKKIVFSLLFSVLVAFLSVNTGYAATWEWINSDDETGYFFDSESIRYELKRDYADRIQSVDTKRITYWLKIIYTPKGAEELAAYFDDDRFRNVESSISLETISLSEKTITCYTLVFYDNGLRTVYSESDAGYVHKIIPESRDEEVFNKIRNYATAHSDLLMKNAYDEN
jgi:hypothetical protein